MQQITVDEVMRLVNQKLGGRPKLELTVLRSAMGGVGGAVGAQGAGVR
jgi:hypothetical protein